MAAFFSCEYEATIERIWVVRAELLVVVRAGAHSSYGQVGAIELHVTTLISVLLFACSTQLCCSHWDVLQLLRHLLSTASTVLAHVVVHWLLD